ncbi:hypothetical protein ACOME3_007485 [Neoechinorhynchus agilis]
MEVIGSNYPPPQWRSKLASVLFYLKFAIIALIATGNQIPISTTTSLFARAYTWALNNRGYACALLFLVIGTIESSCLATGAFEVFLNDQRIFSKLETGRLPNLNELLQGISGVST